MIVFEARNRENPCRLQRQKGRFADLLKLRFDPVISCSNVDDQGHRERSSMLHFIADSVDQHIEFGSRRFENEFIVDLQQHPACQLSFSYHAVNTNHGNLDQVRR